MRRISYEEARKIGLRGLSDHVIANAERGQRFAIRRHDSAPRGGQNLNMFGDPRSAPGEAPAPETGRLGRALEMPPRVQHRDTERVEVTITVNYAWLEYYDAMARIAPRPIGVPMRDFLMSGRGQ